MEKLLDTVILHVLFRSWGFGKSADSFSYQLAMIEKEVFEERGLSISIDWRGVYIIWEEDGRISPCEDPLLEWDKEWMDWFYSVLYL